MSETKRRGPPRKRRERKRTCPRCGGVVAPPRDTSSWDCPSCGWFGDRGETIEVEDGRIRGPEDVARRIAGARERRKADPIFEGRELLAALHDLYCTKAEAEEWVEIMAADSWAEIELTRHLRRKIHRTQVRRYRMALEGLGYVRTLRNPTRHPLVKAAEEYRRNGRRPPIFVEVLKAPKEEQP